MWTFYADGKSYEVPTWMYDERVLAPRKVVQRVFIFGTNDSHLPLCKYIIVIDAETVFGGTIRSSPRAAEGPRQQSDTHYNVFSSSPFKISIKRVKKLT